MPRQSRQQRTATLPMRVVKLGSRGTQLGSPVFPCNRTSSGPVRMSPMCQQETYAPQQLPALTCASLPTFAGLVLTETLHDATTKMRTRLS